MLDLAAFLDRYPEFRAVGQSSPATIQAALDDAAALTDATVFGSQTNLAHGLKAAAILAASPWGREARLVKDSKVSTYEAERIKLDRLVGAGWGTT